MGPARRDSVPEILLEPAIGDLARELAPTRPSSRELVLGGRNASGEIVVRRADRADSPADGTVAETARGTDDTVPGLLGSERPALARGSGPIGADEPKVALELELPDLESKRMHVAAKVRADAELARTSAESDVVDDLLLDPWFFKTEEEIAAIEDDPTARIIEIKIAPVLDVSAFDDDRWVF